MVLPVASIDPESACRDKAVGLRKSVWRVFQTVVAVGTAHGFVVLLWCPRCVLLGSEVEL